MVGPCGLANLYSVKVSSVLSLWTRRIPQCIDLLSLTENSVLAHNVTLHSKRLEDQLQAQLKRAVSAGSHYRIPTCLVRCGTTTTE